MESFEKGLFPSKSTASPKSTGFGENNENDSSQDKMIPQFQNHRKTNAKHFMSPTISAASKAASPRKKILGERKENLGICGAQDHKKFNLNWNRPQNSNSSYRFSYRNVPSHDLVSESEDDVDIKFSDDSSAKAYDPSKKKFLSPRPKYLSFNPNRRLEIVERLEREARDELISSSESQEVNDEVESSPDEIDDSCFSPPKGSVVGAESVENTEEDDVSVNHESDEEEEEEEEEKEGWCFRGLLKVVLTLIACLLSTSYICSMNSPTPSPSQEAIWKLRDGYLMIQRQTLEFVSTKMHNVGSLEMEVGDDYIEVEDAVIDEDYGGVEESVNAETDVDAVEYWENDDIAKDETTIYVDSLKEEDDLNKIEASKAEILGGGGVESETQNSDLLTDAKSDEDYAWIESVGAEIDVDAVENVANDGDEDEDEITIYVDSLKEEDNLNKVKASKSEIIEGGGVESETHNSVQLQEVELSMKSISEETPKESKFVGDMDSSQPAIGFHEKLTESLTEVDEMEGPNLLKSVPEETPKLEELVPLHEKLTDEIVYGNEVEMEKKAGWNTTASVIGIFAALFSTFLAAVYHSKKTRSPPAKESKSILKPHKFPVQEKAVDKKVEFLARPSSPPRSIEEARTELSHHLYAPSVELLGEIEVGIHRSYKKHEPEFEEGNATFVTPTKQQSVAASSPSYGSFTNEKMLKKEEGPRVGDTTPSITPVRRSNRLRNRAAPVITSPY